MTFKKITKISSFIFLISFLMTFFYDFLYVNIYISNLPMTAINIIYEIAFCFGFGLGWFGFTFIVGVVYCFIFNPLYNKITNKVVNNE